MSLTRRLLLAAAAAPVFAAPAAASSTAEPFTLLLDWFVNPDHAPLFVAQHIGAFAAAGLNVTMIAPTDPDLPPKLLAAGHADAALSYQSELYLLVDQGLPVRRTGTLIDKPLDTLTALAGSGIRSLKDFKGRKIGYSVAGFEDVLIGTMLASAGLKLTDVTLTNVNFALVTSLLSHEVDGVIGTYRTYEDIQLRQQGANPVIFYPEDYGVPPSEELIILSNAARLKDPRLPRFLAAVQHGAAYLKAHPAEMWTAFAKANPTLNDALNHASWAALQPDFASRPASLDAARYLTYRDFMFKSGLLKKSLPLADYAVEITS
jgi:putative hydroxymethylpyrimidine transport system substrate-binding protein